MLPALIVLVLLFAGLAVFIAGRPDEFRTARAALINAPAAAIFPHVNDLHHWEAWSPWAKMDPDSKSHFDGPESGQGASMAWDGNAKVGAGRMTIIESRPSDLLRLQLDFLRPFKATNITEFTFTPEGDQTRISWTMTGKNKWIGKAMSLVMDCDKMVGGQFDQGLASLKAIVERQ